MEKCVKVAALFIASLQALAIVHTRNHWLCKGNAFYAQHQLFERLYEATIEDLDASAEKFIGIFGPDCLDLTLQASLLNKAILNYNVSEGDPVAQSLAFEKDFIKLCRGRLRLF